MEEFISNYNLFYLLLCILILPYVFVLEVGTQYHKCNIYDSFLSILILIFSIYVVGTRGIDVGTDTASYIRDFTLLSGATSLTDGLAYIRGGGDPLFTAITYFSTKIGDEVIYLTLLAFLFIFPLGKFVFLHTKNKRLILLLAFFSIYSFKWMAVNTVRSGVALAFGLLFIYYAFHGKKSRATIYALLAMSFHISAGLVLIAYLSALFIKKKWLLYIMLFCASALSFVGIGVHNFPIVADISRLSAYFDGSQDYQVGFSFSYWLYNILIAAYFFFMDGKIDDKYYTHLGKMFVVLSSIYFLSFHIAYSDRIGVYSWAMIPILITYPFLKFRVVKEKPNVILIGILLCFQALAVFYLKR